MLRSVGVGVQWIARRSPRIGSTALRLAVGNIHRPGALTPSVVLSLGLGLTLLVTLALIDGDLRRQISGSLTERAPNFFFVDIQAAEVDAFDALIRQEAPTGRLVKVPMLRGRVMAINGVEAQKLQRAARGRMGAARRSRPDLCRRRSGKRHARAGRSGGRRTIPASRWSRSRPTKARRSA